MTDFELALGKAIAEVWPKANQRKCLFHLKQALKRWIQRELGQTTASSWWPRVEAIVTKLATSVSLEQFERTLRELCEVCRASAKTKSFLQYFLDTYVQRFPPSQWAACFALDATERSHRTNNCCESHNRILKSLCPGGRLSLADGCARLGKILQMEQLDSMAEAEQLGPLRNVTNGTSAVELLRNVLHNEQLEQPPVHEAVMQIPFSRRQLQHQHARVDDGLRQQQRLVENELQQRGLELAPERTTLAGECFFQVVVDSGGAPEGASPASERMDLVLFINNLDETQQAEIQNFLEEDFDVWLQKLYDRRTYVDHVAIQLWVDMTQQPLTIVRDDGTVVQIVPRVPGRVERAPIHIFHQVQGQHYRSLVRRAVPLPQAAAVPPPAVPQTPTVASVEEDGVCVTPQAPPSQLQVLRHAEHLAVSLRDNNKEKGRGKERKTPSAATLRKREREAEVDEEEARALAVEIRRGYVPPVPTVDGELRGNRLKKAREKAERKRAVIARAQEIAEQQRAPLQQVQVPQTPSRATAAQSHPQAGLEPRQGTGSFSFFGFEFVLEPAILGQLVELLIQRAAAAENAPRATPPVVPDTRTPTTDVVLEELQPEVLEEQIPQAEAPPQRRGRRRKASKGAVLHCSLCSLSSVSRPELEFVNCSSCNRSFHKKCVSKWVDEKSCDFRCKKCNPSGRQKE